MKSLCFVCRVYGSTGNKSGKEKDTLERLRDQLSEVCIAICPAVRSYRDG